MAAGDFGEAAEVLAALVAEGNAPWIARNDLALCRFMLEDLAGALELLEGALAEDHQNPFASLNRYYLEEAHKIRTAPPPDPLSKIVDAIGEGPETARVTVVMPTFNRPLEIRESIESVRAQTMPDWELIVVNDGGGRAVEKTIRDYAGDRRVRYVYAEHGGLSSVRNVGMALAGGEYIGQLDDDDIFYPEHLETTLRAFEKNPGAKVAYTDFYRARQEKRGGEWVTVKRVVDYSNDFSRELLKSSTIAPVCNVTHHRDLLETAGYYNEHILRAMDWEYFIRLSKLHDFIHVKEVTGEFRQKSDRSQMTRSFKIPRNRYRNLVSYIHGFFPLTGQLFAGPGAAEGERFHNALARLLEADRDRFLADRIELRKLLSEPPYALFYTLGKRLSEEGERELSRLAFRAAARTRPLEPKIWLKCLRPS